MNAQKVGSMDEAEGWERIGPWLEQAIIDSGRSQAQLLRDAGMAHQTLAKLLRGEPVGRRERLSALARALGYQVDAFDAVRRGEPPTRVIDLPTIDGSDTARLNAVEERLDRIEEAVGRLLERGAP